jgi:uncharacterized membrane protein (DUF2068 family)
MMLAFTPDGFALALSVTWETCQATGIGVVVGLVFGMGLWRMDRWTKEAKK